MHRGAGPSKRRRFRKAERDPGVLQGRDDGLRGWGNGDPPPMVDIIPSRSSRAASMLVLASPSGVSMAARAALQSNRGTGKITVNAPAEEEVGEMGGPPGDGKLQ